MVAELVDEDGGIVVSSVVSEEDFKISSKEGIVVSSMDVCA